MFDAVGACRLLHHINEAAHFFSIIHHTGASGGGIWAAKHDEQGSVREQFVLDAVQTKGAKTRTIWINAKLRRQLELYRSSLFFKDSNRALFQSQKGGAFSANTMTQLFLNIYRAAGFENASSHSGRRTFITELASKGVSVRVLAELAGHSSIQTTQRYIDVNPQQMSAAVELL